MINNIKVFFKVNIYTATKATFEKDGYQKEHD